MPSNLSSVQPTGRAGFESNEPNTIEAVNKIDEDGSDSPPEFVIKPFEKSIQIEADDQTAVKVFNGGQIEILTIEDEFDFGDDESDENE